MNRTNRFKEGTIKEVFECKEGANLPQHPPLCNDIRHHTSPPSAAVAQSGAATAANIAGKGRCVAFSAIALRVIRDPAVAEIHFREDGQCDVNAQFPESLGEPLWNTAGARKVTG